MVGFSSFDRDDKVRQMQRQGWGFVGSQKEGAFNQVLTSRR
jgi:hypothetical protein